MKREILYIWLQQALGICNTKARELLIAFKSVEDIYSCGDYSFLGDKFEKYAKRLADKDTGAAFEVLKRCRALGAGIVGYYDKEFPSSLRLIAAPPVALYYIGTLRDFEKTPCVSVVGTRKMTDYGKETAESFAYAFAKSGITVVSGLARGVDTAAHRGAVAAGGYTVGVLGNPIGDVYPRENVKAFETLYKRGLVISEMYPGCPRTRADFPNRNRLISGFSRATVIAEAGEGSGALITAKCALEQGRAVYAVPGAIGAENAGTNELIKKGCAVATDPYDVIAPLSLEYPEAVKPYEPSLTRRLRSYGNAGVAGSRRRGSAPESEPIEEFAEEPEIPKTAGSDGILELLGKKDLPLSADEIARATGMDISSVLTELTILEISGEIIKSPGGLFSRV